MMESRVVKVRFGDDIRRLMPNFLPSAGPEEILTTIRSAIQSSFGLEETTAATMVLKYTDDEGDLCTLTERTLEDLASLVPTGTLKLHMCLPSSPVEPSAPSMNY